MDTTTTRQIEAIEQALGIFLASDQVSELRVLGVAGRKAVCQVFSDWTLMARRAAELDGQDAKGVYFTPNPLRPDLAGSQASAKKDDVSSRRWLLIDCDAIRAASTNASEGERQSAWNVLCRVRGTLDGAGCRGAVVGDSGNGWHLCYPIDLPADEAAQELIKTVLRGLHARCSDQQSRVDTSTHDAPRIWKLYGTRARKGPAEPDRPHRWARLVEGEPWSAEAARANNAALRRLLDIWAWIEQKRTQRPAGSLIERARAYIRKEPPAISGQHGHDRAFHVACVLVKDFGLGLEDALAAIQEWNATCQPPWSEAELRHKLEDAEKAPGPVGRLAQANGNSAHNGAAPNLLGDTPSNDPQDIVRKRMATVEVIEHDALLDANLPPPRWLVHELVAHEGLTMLGGKKKLGKSWLCLQIAQAVADGARCLHREVIQGPVIYICLEDGRRRLKQRLEKQQARRGLPVTYFTRFPPLDGEGMPQLISLIETRQPRLLIIDTLAAAKTGKTVENDAGPMADLTNSLRALAQHFALGILVTHHHGKSVGGDPGDDLRGSSAIAGAADVNLGLYRDEAGGFDLKGEGRDVDQFSLRVSFDRENTWGWQLVGESRQVDATQADQELLDALRALGEADASAIAEVLHRNRAAVSRRLIHLANLGVVTPREESAGARGRPRILYRIMCAHANRPDDLWPPDAREIENPFA